MGFRTRFKPAARPAFDAELDEDLEYDLLHGHSLIQGTGFGKREAAFRQAWVIHGAGLLPAWIAEHPGTRPFGQWVCEIVPTHGPREFLRDPLSWTAKRFGIFHTNLWRVRPDGSRDHLQLPQEVYLARHGLLDDDELRRAKARLENDLDPGRFVWPDDLN